MKNLDQILNVSELITTRTGLVAVLSSGLGGFITLVYGSQFNLMCMLALSGAIVFDWIGGSAASKKDGTYASEYGLQGIGRTVILLLIPAWGVLLDNIFNAPNVMFFMFWGGIMFHTINSMTANFVRAGWDKWIPVWAINYVASEIEAKLRRSESRIHKELTPIEVPIQTPVPPITEIDNNGK